MEGPSGGHKALDCESGVSTDQSKTRKSSLQEIAVAPAVGVRKSSYGRTTIFLSEDSVALREFKSTGGIRVQESASVYHTLPSLESAHASGELCCWHCCEPIPARSTLFPIPRFYDTSDRLYHVYGATCSPGCAKAYVIEHSSFDRGKQLSTLTNMLRVVYGIEGKIVETPPRPSLRRFGGPFDPRQIARSSCSLVQPPFVSYCMIVDEHTTPDDAQVAKEAVAERINKGTRIPQIPAEDGRRRDLVSEYETFLSGRRREDPMEVCDADDVSPSEGRDTNERDNSKKATLGAHCKKFSTPAKGPMSKYVNN